MFYMKNKEGNAYKKVYSVHKKEALEDLGYTLVSDDGQKVEDNTPVDPPADNTSEPGIPNIDDMTVSELKEFAAANNIDLEATKKADIIEEIKKAVSAQQID